MLVPKRPRDPIARAKVVMDMRIGETPNDKAQVLGTEPEQSPRTSRQLPRQAHRAARPGRILARHRPPSSPTPCWR